MTVDFSRFETEQNLGLWMLMFPNHVNACKCTRSDREEQSSELVSQGLKLAPYKR